MKPNLKTVTAELAVANEKIAALTAQLQSAQQEATNLRTVQGSHENELSEVNAQLRTAKDVLAPFAKAKDLDWPDPAIEAVRPITFGHLKAACDLACTFR
jgi:hypothetical protein